MRSPKRGGFAWTQQFVIIYTWLYVHKGHMDSDAFITEKLVAAMLVMPI